MPMLQGKSKQTITRNFVEMLQSRSKAGKMRMRKGKKKAAQMAWAAAYEHARKSK